MTRRLSTFSMPQVEDPQVLKILEKEAELRPRWADVQNRWGLHHLSRGRYPEAKAAFERALEQNPYYAWAGLNLAATLWLMGDREAAWDQHRNTKDLQPGKALTAAWMHVLAGNPEAAESELSGITEASRERPDMLWLKTAAAESKGLDGSRPWHLLLTDPLIMDDPDCVAGMKTEADDAALFPGFHDYWTGVSTIQARLGRFEGATLAARRAYIFFSDSAKFLNQRAYLKSMQGDEAAAAAFYRQALETCPKDVTAPQALARYHFSLDDLEQAQYFMRIALDRGPNYADLQREMAQLQAAAGNDEAALEWVRKALSVNPNFRTAQLEEAFYLFCLSRWEESARAYRRSIDFHLQSADVYLHLGRCYEYLGETRQAEDAYKASIKMNPEEAIAYYRLSLLYQSQGKTALAKDSWDAYQDLVDRKPASFPPDARSFEDELRPLPEHAA